MRLSDFARIEGDLNRLKRDVERTERRKEREEREEQDPQRTPHGCFSPEATAAAPMSSSRFSPPSRT